MDWATKLGVPKSYESLGAEIAGEHRRAITLAQIQATRDSGGVEWIAGCSLQTHRSEVCRSWPATLRSWRSKCSRRR